jgi:pimeloyl-ACP methyl ester carboxylesterase
MGNTYAKTNGHVTGLPQESRFVMLGTNRVHYRTVGKGDRDVFFIHGWAGNMDIWREQVPALAPEARLILIDLPGHGKSDKPQTAYTMDFFANAVQAVLREARVNKAAFVVHSMGGAVMCRVYERAPEKFASVISVDGLLRRPTGTAEQVESLLAPFSQPEYLDHARRLIHSFFPIPGTEVLRDRLMSEMLATPQHVMLGGMQAMFSPEHSDWVLPKINAPVAVINAPGFLWRHGYEDYIRSATPRADYMIMDGVGHYAMLEKPAEFNATLSAMLRKYGSLA